MPEAASPPRRPRWATLRWRLTIVYGAVAVTVGLLLLLLSILLVDRAARAGAQLINPSVGLLLPDGSFVTFRQIQDQLRQDALRQLSRTGLLALLLVGTVSYGVATTQGLVSVVAVLATLAPVVTVTMAVVLLGERLARRQQVGVGTALVGVVLLAAG